MHTKDALAGGESVERIIQLGAWEESRHFYTRRSCGDRADRGGHRHHDGFVSDEVYERAAEQFEEPRLSRS